MIRSVGMVVATIALTASCGGQVPDGIATESTPTPLSVVRDPVDGVVTQRQSERLGLTVGDGLCSLSALSQRLNTEGLTLKRLQAGFLTDEPGVTQWAAEMFGAWSDVSGWPSGKPHALCWFEADGALDALNDGTVAPVRFVVIDATVTAPFAASVLVSSPDPIAVVTPRPPVNVPLLPLVGKLLAAIQPVGVKVVDGESGAERSRKVDTQAVLDSVLPDGKIPVN